MYYHVHHVQYSLFGSLYMVGSKCEVKLMEEFQLESCVQAHHIYKSKTERMIMSNITMY